jgi:2-iminobutanoate/2-iminopropanoate deaminase
MSFAADGGFGCGTERLDGDGCREFGPPGIGYHSAGRTMPTQSEKTVYDAGLPSSNAPFNLCVRHGDLIFISGLPPFDEAFSGALREAREKGLPIPPFPNPPFEQQARLVMDNMKKLVEAAGSNMDCLLKVIVWLRDQRDAEQFDRIYRTYFTSRETLPARTRIQAGRTPLDCGLEVEAIGYVPRKSAHRSATTRRGATRARRRK